MKKLLTLLLSLTLAIGVFAACGGEKDPVVALITLHDESSTYDANFINAFKAACEAKGLKKSQYKIVSNIPEEGDDCYTEAANFAKKGYKAVFADSFGHEANMIKAAKEYTDVQFCHATGTKAHTENLANYHNAFASIYEGRYLAGVAAGIKLNAMIAAGEFTAEEAKIGYVGAFPYAEVISGYTSFYLGAKSVCPTVTMTVRFTNSWYALEAEYSTAMTLITSDKCKLISGHADSMGAPNACEEKGVPNVFYNNKTDKDTWVISSRINWQPYFELMIDNALGGAALPVDYTGTIATGSVEVLELGVGPAAVTGTKEALEEVIAQFKAGTLKVFNTANFTVDGQTVTTYKADVDDDGTFTGETEVILNGYFNESTFRSAPYFDLTIDGIEKVVAA
ncbi:MAG: BMP family ABC transporter substrate-binding protein [Clostridia bacterium]|nr:BMP family ABC transporter substrate-binding protein [Clostridia bacterium]